MDTTLTRTRRGVSSALAGYAVHSGGWWLGQSWRSQEGKRLDAGLILVLPGVEGAGPLNWSVIQGLADAGEDAAVRLVDWTTGYWPAFPYHLRAGRRNRRKARAIAHMVAKYQYEYPGRPVHLIGHSGGAGMAVWALEALPETPKITSAVLLGAALSPRYNLAPALARMTGAMHHFFSPLDVVFLALGTTLFGTFDGRHSGAAGWRGFVKPRGLTRREQDAYRTQLHQHRYRPGMLSQFHPGGHFGWANRVFVAERIAPLLREAPITTQTPSASAPYRAFAAVP